MCCKALYTSPLLSLLVELHKILHIVFTAKENWCAFVDILWMDVEDAARTRRCYTASLERKRVSESCCWNTDRIPVL
jgi:hypothetical protein